MRKSYWLAILMTITILGISCFQLFWLKENYDREKQNLGIKLHDAFQKTIDELRASHIKIEEVNYADSSVHDLSILFPKVTIRRKGKDTTYNISREKTALLMIDMFERKERVSNFKAKQILKSSPDSFIKRIFVNLPPNTKDSSISDPDPMPFSFSASNGIISGNLKINGKKIIIKDSIHVRDTSSSPKNDIVRNWLFSIDSIFLKDPIPATDVSKTLSDKLKADGIKDLNFNIEKFRSDSLGTTSDYEITIGIAQPITYRLNLQNEVFYLIKTLKLPISFSLLLIGITIISFIVLYRSLLQQKRLTELKNGFISNITHELKTPIATVGVAIEALKSFNVLHNPQRTEEYLDISQKELQRLSLLVDKVLKLSMFEKKEIELKKEFFNFKELVEEVLNSMKLQFEKCNAEVQLYSEGEDFTILADKVHIASVVYNLLDNAIKYSQANPTIKLKLLSTINGIKLSVSDNGIGIENAYKVKIFDKFFRVPTGDEHNIKGYGLGLSYVAEIMKRHNGFISVESDVGKGSTFIAIFPFCK